MSPEVIRHITLLILERIEANMERGTSFLGRLKAKAKKMPFLLMAFALALASQITYADGRLNKRNTDQDIKAIGRAARKHLYVLVVADPGAVLASGNPRLTASFRLADTIPRPRGLPPDLEHLYTLVVADPGAALALGNPRLTASFRHPEAAAWQAPWLARQVLVAAGQVPPSDPVDLHIIGHREGPVVNSHLAGTISLPQGLPPDLEHPYILVVADPGAALASGNPRLTTSFRLADTIPLPWGLPPDLEHPYTLVVADPGATLASGNPRLTASFRHPGAAAWQAPWLARQVLVAAGQVPPSDPIDLHSYQARVRDPAVFMTAHSDRTGVVWWDHYKIVPTLGEGAPEVRSHINLDRSSLAVPAGQAAAKWYQLYGPLKNTAIKLYGPLKNTANQQPPAEPVV